MSLSADGSNRIDVERRRAMHSGGYVRSFEHKPMSRLARLLPRMHLRHSDSVVDVACGNAMLLELIHGSVARYHGVDFSADFITAAEARAERLGARNAQFDCEDVEAFCTAHPEAFDVATAMDFTEHIYDDDMLRMFSALRKSLKPGGRLYVHTPNRDFFLELMSSTGCSLSSANTSRCGTRRETSTFSSVADSSGTGFTSPTWRTTTFSDCCSH